jgi:transcriptional regulator with XRE-family HTH domain
MQNPEISKLIKAIRKRTDWTQERLAREIGITFSTVNEWENGKRQPHPYLLKKLQELEAASKKLKK